METYITPQLRALLWIRFRSNLCCQIRIRIRNTGWENTKIYCHQMAIFSVFLCISTIHESTFCKCVFITNIAKCADFFAQTEQQFNYSLLRQCQNRMWTILDQITKSYKSVGQSFRYKKTTYILCWACPVLFNWRSVVQ